ncbi:hypothetical protein P280DRAFT_467710 [Massarina eburnea CBS 473.64]|uniref:Protein prenylyltransferase n=1 Tax=Massarina eburnea CBS 473.64 TaxID=1395130 RepID=A0A6A6S835_9PLEO|nr:hypothetical protein P280DRAFT_467710 [Massarina eburnea CBS 473.64]
MTSIFPTQEDLQPYQAYDHLDAFFTAHQDEVVEIEILPSGFDPTDGFSMQQGIHIGIPKKVLRLAFLDARSRFFDTGYVWTVSCAPVSLEDGGLTKDMQTKLQSTRIMLLFDPEHLTAANYRKRCLENRMKLMFADKVIDHEVQFLNSILTSPLHRQSKSPTLWNHRYWLVSKYCVPRRLNDLVDFVLQELGIVCKSSERHPRNYYAFGYARRLVDQVKNEFRSDFPKLLTNAVAMVGDWCLRNPSDTSGWSFLTFLLQSMPHGQDRGVTVHKIVDYAITLRLRNESLWNFIRGRLADGTLTERWNDSLRSRLWVERYGGSVADNDEVQQYRVRVAATLDWEYRFRVEGMRSY